MTRPLTEFVCEDCMDADHEACRRQGGWPFQDADDRCGCHLTDHRLDNREPSTLCEDLCMDECVGACGVAAAYTEGDAQHHMYLCAFHGGGTDPVDGWQWIGE